MHESLPQNKTGFLKEEHWAVGAVQEAPCKGECLCPPVKVLFLTQWTDSWKSQCWPEIKFWCRSGVQSLRRLLLTQARLDYTTVERTRAIISELVPCCAEEPPKQLVISGCYYSLCVTSAVFQAVRSGRSSEYPTVLLFLCSPSAKAGIWKPQAHRLYLVNNY